MKESITITRKISILDVTIKLYTRNLTVVNLYEFSRMYMLDAHCLLPFLIGLRIFPYKTVKFMPRNFLENFSVNTYTRNTFVKYIFMRFFYALKMEDTNYNSINNHILYEFIVQPREIR